ncbi:MAG: YeeE/YedE thiosulfate transporter family protein [Hyphomicrobiaceae bacterium]
MLVLVSLLAFVVGFSVHRGTNCSVVAAEQLVRRRDPTRLASFLVGAAAAMAIAIPVLWADPGRFKVATTQGLTWAAVIGGAGYGLGALLNGACALGTFVRISEGRLSFLAAIPGVGIGATLASGLGLAGYRQAMSPAVMATPGTGQLAAVLCAALIAIAALRATDIHLHRRRIGLRALLRAPRWRPMLSMLITGGAGGLAYILSDAWTWPSLTRRLAEILGGGPVDLPLPMLLGAASLFAGAFTAASLSGRFRVRAEGFTQTLRSLFGGTVMGGSAALIPGGNDTLLLQALPALATSGLIAYAAMFGVLLPALFVIEQVRAASASDLPGVASWQSRSP